jgi:hypothetical protein
MLRLLGELPKHGVFRRSLSTPPPGMRIDHPTAHYTDRKVLNAPNVTSAELQAHKSGDAEGSWGQYGRPPGIKIVRVSFK